MRIKGTKVESVEIEVTPADLLGGLQRHFGLGEVFSPKNETYWEWSEDGNTLVEMMDISRHGSPCYVESGRKITTDKSLKAYMLLTELKKLMED